MSKIQKSTEESGGSDETQVFTELRHLSGRVSKLSTLLNRLSRKVLGLKRKLKIKKHLSLKEAKLVSSLFNTLDTVS
jgi:transposase